VTVVTKAGKKIRYRGGTWFQASMIQIAPGRECCDALKLGAAIGVVLVAGLAIRPKETWETRRPAS
jgi:hypothetical protein